MSPNLAYWLAATFLPITPRTFQTWLTFFSSIQALFHASASDLATIGLQDTHIYALLNPNWAAVEKELSWQAAAPGRQFLTLEDTLYPKLLKAISDPPLVLAVQGNPGILSQRQLAIVGTRRPTPAGIKQAEQFAHELAEMGMVITSGMALGIDGAAHRGTLKANGLTVAVAGTGLQHIYPASHRQLVEEVLKAGGVMLSEFPHQTPPRPMNFPRRNRIIAGLSVGVLVVEAALKSGSLITARHALEHGREVFAIPGSIHNPVARGCHHLIREGAILVEKTADIVQEIDIFYGAPKPAANQLPELSDTQSQLLMQIEYEITPLDMLILRSGLTASEVSSILLTLELNGYIQSVPGGYRRLDQ